ncbi:MAG TPA: type III-B CRISPR module RAMP protein Cmr4 [Polyangiaceae bacterium]|nr:type III-B CRISPR module RAMP protein Cmr4 [Polyangiaceae bacterium]HQM10512.1 type III-B CRISPR module RAMP protein Cmr4 [Polyangiaceae bacterium]
MSTDSVVLSLYFETPLHAPSGSVVGTIEQPVQRERTTQWPVIYASTLESSLRTSFMQTAGEQAAKALFGDDNGGGLSISDARLLLFPVRSSAAPFLWLTCPAVVSRLRRDLGRTVGIQIPPAPSVKTDEIVTSQAWSHGDSPLAADDIVLKPRAGYDASKLMALLPSDSSAYDVFAKEVEASFGLVSDEVFGFLVRTGTEVRVIDGVLGDEGNPCYDEAIPADSLFYVPIIGIGTKEAKATALTRFAEGCGTHVRVGNGEPIGRGWARTRLLKAEGSAQ